MDYLLFPAGIVLLLNGICSACLLIRELSTPSRRWMVWVIASLLALLFATFLEGITGYYLAVPHAEIATFAVAFGAYFFAMFILLFGRRMAWRLNRIVAIIGICMPIMIPILSPATLVVALYIFGTTNSPVFQGRISPTTSYKITIDRSLIGNGSFYNYTVYSNPRWFPFVQKRIENGPTLSCDVPSEKVEIRPGKDANTVTLLCNTNGNQQPPQEIALH